MWATGLRALARSARRSGCPQHAEQLQQLRWLNIHEYQVPLAEGTCDTCLCLPLINIEFLGVGHVGSVLVHACLCEQARLTWRK